MTKGNVTSWNSNLKKKEKKIKEVATIEERADKKAAGNMSNLVIQDNIALQNLDFSTLMLSFLSWLDHTFIWTRHDYECRTRIWKSEEIIKMSITLYLLILYKWGLMFVLLDSLTKSQWSPKLKYTCALYCVLIWKIQKAEAVALVQ